MIRTEMNVVGFLKQIHQTIIKILLVPFLGKSYVSAFQGCTNYFSCKAYRLSL